MTKNFSFKKLFKALVIIALILAVSAAIVVPSVLYGLGVYRLRRAGAGQRRLLYNGVFYGQ